MKKNSDKKLKRNLEVEKKISTKGQKAILMTKKLKIKILPND